MDNYHYKWHTEKKYLKLEKFIEPCNKFSGIIWNRQCDEEKAQTVLLNFFNALQKIKPDKKLNLGLRTGYYSFLINMIPLQQAVSNNKYALACHELCTLFYNEPILQERIYYNLMLLYKTYLGK